MNASILTKENQERFTQLVALIEWLAWANGLVEQDEALLIQAHLGMITGRVIWDVSGLPEQKRKPVLDMIEQIKNGTHPSQLDPGYVPARIRNGEPDPGLPVIETKFNL